MLLLAIPALDVQFHYVREEVRQRGGTSFLDSDEDDVWVAREGAVVVGETKRVSGGDKNCGQDNQRQGQEYVQKVGRGRFPHRPEDASREAVGCTRTVSGGSCLSSHVAVREKQSALSAQPSQRVYKQGATLETRLCHGLVVRCYCSWDALVAHSSQGYPLLLVLVLLRSLTSTWYIRMTQTE